MNSHIKCHTSELNFLRNSEKLSNRDFSQYSSEMKNNRIPKLSEFGTSEKPPSLIFGKQNGPISALDYGETPPKSPERTYFGILFLGNPSEIPP